MIILITAHKKFTIESYELNALDYMVDPVQEERFAMAAIILCVLEGMQKIKYFANKTRIDFGRTWGK